MCAGDTLFICCNMYRREIKLSEARHSRRRAEITPANLLNGKNVMQYKRNLSHSKAFTQRRNFKFIEAHTRDKEVEKGWANRVPHPSVGKHNDPVVREKGQRAEGRGQGLAWVLARLNHVTYGKSLSSLVWTEWPCCPRTPFCRRSFRVMGTPGRIPRGVLRAPLLRPAWWRALYGAISCLRRNSPAGACDYPHHVKRKSGAWRGCVSPEAIWL